MSKEVLVQGSTPGALRAAENLADCGLYVHLIESGPFIAEEECREEPFYLRNTRLLEILKNPHIQTWTNTEIKDIESNGDHCRIDLKQSPRYIDLSRCTACGECVEICPVTIPNTQLKAIHLGGQPDCAVITKEGLAPCSYACPAGIHVQGYVALIADGRYSEAYQLIHDALPFPSVCGRVCNHYCETSCSRLKIDEAVNIMGLKRFVSDWVLEEGDKDLTPPLEEHPLIKDAGEKRVAIIGAGPAGLTAARDLVRAGYEVKVFDANPKAGGMMRVGIPPHRLPYDHLDLEIQQIIAEGVELKLNTWVDDIPGLLENGFAAVLIATGAHQAIKVPLENADHPDNWLSLDFLKKVCLGKKINLKGRKVIVLGGGDVAMDSARSAIRLGKPEVTILCRGLRASFNEIKEAEEEGVQVIRNRVFKKVILEKGKIAGVECLEAEVGEVVDGKRQFTELPGTEHLIPGDLIIWAVGQRPDFSFLPEGDQAIHHSSGGIQADPRMMTNLEGVFTAGDVRRGTTFFVVDAVGEGHQAARSIMDYLEGNQHAASTNDRHEVSLSQEEVQKRLDLRRDAQAQRTPIQCLPALERENNFAEVELTMGEKEARIEAGRCLSCGPCSECMACVEVCEPEAIIHNQQDSTTSLEVSGLISPAETILLSGADCLIPLQGVEPLAGAAAAFEMLKENQDPISSDLKINQKLADPGNGTGLVICQCGGEISRHLDTAGICKEAGKWPEISHTLEISSACSPEGAQKIKDLIQTNQLGKLILAACSCCSLDQVCYSCTYQRIRCKGNLGVFSDLDEMGEVEFVNIREGCAYIHPRSKKKATIAARTLIGAALGRTSAPTPQIGESVGLPPVTLVVGEGKSADACLSALSGSGYEAKHLEALSGQVIRTGGRFLTTGPDEELKADCLVLAPSSGAELDYITKSVLLSKKRTILERNHYEDARRLGIFICPPSMDPAVSGRGAAGEVLAWAGKMGLRSRQPAAWVDPLLCRGCGTCLEVCGLGIPDLIVDPDGSHAWINPLLCLDCGTCVAHCPSGAIQPGGQTDLELLDTLKRVLS
jgi:NADPH-dependent glutamate synthase beta subunit-like oxidoreductase/formate hydrogenlyase subunit 6/NADH:ubiquinone oxidoreductase subunit I